MPAKCSIPESLTAHVCKTCGEDFFGAWNAKTCMKCKAQRKDEQGHKINDFGREYPQINLVVLQRAPSYDWFLGGSCA